MNRFDSNVQSEIVEALQKLVANGEWADYVGTETQHLQDELKSTFQREHVYLCCSGTVAVELAIRSLRLRPDDEVLLAGYDFPGNFRACEVAGARIGLTDVAESGWVLNVHQLERAIDKSTKAVVVSHLHGQCAEMAAISEWAVANQIAIIEDACQSPGAVIEGRPAGSWGDLSVISFGGSKLLTAGRGGAVMTNDAQLAQRMKIFAERGNDAFALSQLQAAVIRPQLRSLPKRTQKRAEAVNRIRDKFPTLFSYPSVHHPRPSDLSAYYKLGLLAPQGQREQWLAHLEQWGVRAGAGFLGFHNRSQKRCRHSCPLENSRIAAERTVLIDHRSLNDTSTVIQAINGLAFQ